MSPGAGPPAVDPVAARRLLAYLGVAMVATGQPVFEVEEDLVPVAARLGFPGAQVGAGSTGVTVALASGEPSTFEAVRGPLRLDQSAQVRLIRHRLVRGELTAPDAEQQLVGLRSRPPRYPTWLILLGWVGTSVGISLILQPTVAGLLVTAAASLLVFGLTRLASRSPVVAALLPSVASFVVACLVFGAADAGWLEAPLRTLLPPLAILLPGALLVTGLSDLAAGAMVAGSSRLAYGSVQLLLFTLGIVAGAGLFRVGPSALVNLRVDELGWWSAPLGLLLIASGIALMESVELRLAPWVLLTVTLAFLAQTLGQLIGGAALGGFLGAVAATLGASTVEAVQPRLARLVVFLPAFWLLVPGSLGLLSVTQLAIQPAEASDVAEVVVLITAIALGLLVGSVIARAARSALHRPPTVA